jgi:phosphotransferase system enzyme I (PtsI)
VYNQRGRAIQLSANLGLPHELEKILELGCDGIGLFRTEFLYLSKNRLPMKSSRQRFTDKS